MDLSRMVNKCIHCGETYDDPPPEHFNDCYQWRKLSGSFPPVTMPPSSIDFADPPKHRAIMEKVNVCPNCKREYNWSWQDHAEKCDVTAMNKIKFETSQLGKTDFV